MNKNLTQIMKTELQPLNKFSDLSQFLALNEERKAGIPG